MPSRFFNYALIQCSNTARDERLNLGVVGYDPAKKAVIVRVLDDLTRVEAAFPTIKADHLRASLAPLSEALTDLLHQEGVEAFQKIAGKPTGIVQLSPIRSVRSDSVTSAVRKVLEKYVAMPRALNQASRSDLSPRRGLIPRPIKSVVTRLENTRGYSPADFRRNPEIQGLTRSQHAIPVEFHLEIKQRLLVEALDVSRKSQRNSLDAARIVAMKVEHTFRSTHDRPIAVIMREGEDVNAADYAAEIVASKASRNGSYLRVFRVTDSRDYDGVANDIADVQEDLTLD
jgi:hypothetical protein